MSLFGAVLFGGALYALAKGADAADKTAYMHLDDEEFDKENSRYGIMHNMDEEKLHKVAARCRIRKDRDGRFKYADVERCEEYVQKYALSPDDFDKFSALWDQMVDKQNDVYNQMIIDEAIPLYNSEIRYSLSRQSEWEEYVFEIEHWNNLDYQTHIDRMNKLKTDTFLGKICVQDPILRDYGWSRLETWVLLVPGDTKGLKQHSASVIYGLSCKINGWLE